MQAKGGDIPHNLAKLEQFARDAAKQRADIICFPEMCLQGYSREIPLELAENLSKGHLAAQLQKIAEETGLVLLVGLAEREGQGKPFITHLVVTPRGQVEAYRKVHLGKSEQPHYAPGQAIEVFTTPKANLGLQICWDTHFPEMSTILALQGAEVIFMPHASPTMVGDRRAIWLKYLTARAYDNSVFVAACNLVGEDGQGHHFCGGCLVLDPKGNILAEDFSGKESMLVVDLEADKLNQIREQRGSTMANSFYLQSRRPELYGELTAENRCFSKLKLLPI